MIAFVVSLVMTAVLLPPLIALLHRTHFLDVPNARSSHSTPVPRGGGVAVATGAVIGLLVEQGVPGAFVGMAIGSVALGALGLADDRFGLPTRPRLVVQFVVAGTACVLAAGGTGVSSLLAVVVGTVLLAGYVNAFNFMDGINGISGMQAAVVGVALFLIAREQGLSGIEPAGLAAAGAGIGLLPYNAIRPRVFLGDVGSYFLGFWLAGTALLLVYEGAPAMVVAAPFLLYVFDTTTALVRRFRRGERFGEAHREHAYQLLTQAGWSHLAVALLCTLVTGVASAVMLLVSDLAAGAQVAAFLGCLGLVCAYLWLPHRRLAAAGACS